jgi:FkbM family methyltransferase
VKPSELLRKPEYRHRPTQALKRLLHVILREPEVATVKLPWGLRIRVNPRDDIGRSIWQLGVYDLSLSETIWRLLDSRETAVDVGANIGYVTGLMAVRSGVGGRVISVEPHPRIFQLLRTNVEKWKKEAIAEITTVEAAVSSKNGRAFLEEPPDFGQNIGTARMVPSIPDERTMRLIEVTTARLDEIVGKRDIGLLKLDVEGHELEALSGSQELLVTHAIRDIVYEDHSGSFTSRVAVQLRDLDYAIFGLSYDRNGLTLAPEGIEVSKPSYTPQNFLATCQPQRAFERFRRPGWQVLRAGRPA